MKSHAYMHEGFITSIKPYHEADMFITLKPEYRTKVDGQYNQGEYDVEVRFYIYPAPYDPGPKPDFPQPEHTPNKKIPVDEDTDTEDVMSKESRKVKMTMQVIKEDFEIQTRGRSVWQRI